ncbi:MAG: nucleotidyltransferase family protein [Candidatus Dadabacteria bacterium]|nr:nucleotidyltransferase family protein [Candidatus Dadabacteria bacterium]
MVSKDKLLTILKKELPYLSEQFSVKNIGIFGSYSRNDQTPESDLDILVEFIKPVGFLKFFDLEEYLTERLGMKVELLSSDAIKPLIKNNILADIVYAQ